MRNLPLLLVLGWAGAACGTATTSAPNDTHQGTLTDAASADTLAADSRTPDTAGADTGVLDTVAPDVGPGPAPFYFGGDRPATYFGPLDYDPDVPMPLIIALHGYDHSGAGLDLYFGLSKVTQTRGAMLVIPDGTTSSQGKQFWNATEACCDLEGSGVDDVAYLSGLIEEAQLYFNIDPSRVYLLGHSNGGFMSYRMACGRSDLIAGVVSFAGATWWDPADCGDPDPVAVLQVHGDWDTVILYTGLIPHEAEATPPAWTVESCLQDNCTAPFDACLADTGCAGYYTCLVDCSQKPGANACYTACWNAASGPTRALWMPAYTCGLTQGCYGDWSKSWAGYPSAPEIVKRWAERNGCADTTTAGEKRDLIMEVPAAETHTMSYDGCPAGLGVALWRIEYGGHSPEFTDNWGPAIVDWLLNQAKP